MPDDDAAATDLDHRLSHSPPPRSAAPSAWRSSLRRLRDALGFVEHLPSAPAARATAPGEVWYGIDRGALATDGEVGIFFYRQPRRRDGTLGKPRPVRLEAEQLAAVADGPEREALAILLEMPDDVWWRSDWGGPDATRSRAALPPGLYDLVLPRLASSGRLTWRPLPRSTEPPQPLRWDDGPPWQLRLRAERRDDGALVLEGELWRGEQTLPLTAPAAITAHGLVCFDDGIARLAHPAVTYPWVQLLRRERVVIPREEEEEAVAALVGLPGLPPIEGDVAGLPRHERHPPVPQLVLYRSPRADGSAPAAVRFLYDGFGVRATDPQHAIAADGRVLVRDHPAEQAALGRLLAAGASEVAPGSERPFSIAARLIASLVETLLGDGWQVEAEGAPLRRASRLEWSVASGIDWLDLAIAGDFGGVAPQVEDLLAALASRERFVRLGDGSHGLLPQEWIDRYGILGKLAMEASEDGLRFLPSQALLLDALLAAEDDDGVALQFDAAFERLRDRVRAGGGITAAEPSARFAGTLRPYQKVGLGWLRFLGEVGFGGCLADDMGLGKTVQVLAHLVSTDEQRSAEPPAGKRRDKATRLPSLVVAPKSVVHNWLDEAARFAPSLRVMAYGGADRDAQRKAFAAHDLVITTYGMVRRDAALLAGQRFSWLVLDEAQAVKSAYTQTHKACRLLQAEHRLALSGTPVENHLGELWSLLELLNPGLLGRLAGGRSSDRGASLSDEELLAVGRAVRPFILRRTKEQVLRELPEKTEQTLHCVLEPAQRRLYDQLKRYYQTSLAARIETVGIARSKIQILEALLRLRQAACHPALIDPTRADEPSAKLDTLVEQLVELAAEGHKALVFSQFTRLLGLVKPALQKAGLTYEYLDGHTRDRRAKVERFFADPNCPVFLISLKAGGLGLNLTAASYVFLLDPWWNPAVEAQAIDRAHRIGQHRPVFAYRLIAEDTVEQRILELQQRKRRVADAILAADASALERLTTEDLDLLLR